ncbi:cupin domain-containing protein [Stieleria mannarensis]|uniref:cupin domain-containing protein n=1 Tax=Stieleria mannarensis TaxID=2755585 RepID=UPI0016029EE2|nr:cupin domain-containing protein [Rhodopirellula sp. JC639]
MTERVPAEQISAVEGPAIVDLAALPGVECPCGIARRGFAQRDDFPGTIHLTRIDRSAQTHYHTEHTEVYVVLECDDDAAIELNGELHPVKPKTSILIPPGTRHRAVGCMEVLIVCLPKFDPADEHFD